jgi:multidrug efflux pump subunit AcrB
VPDIVNAIQQQNQLTPAGQIGGAAGGARHRVHLHGPHAGAPAQRRGVRRHRGPEPRRLAGEVRLKDVARLELGTMLYNSSAGTNGKPSAVIAIFQIPGTNALDVAEPSRRRWKSSPRASRGTWTT